jgi:hypothetical protein
MSVNSILTSLSPSYSPLSGNKSQTAKSAIPADEIAEKTFAKASVSQETSAEVDGATRDASIESDDAVDASQFHSTFGQARRQNGATAGRSTSETADSPRGRSPGIALYQRVSQYGNNEPSTSALLESWNKIMQGGQDADSAAAAFLKAFSATETPGSPSSVLDLTA